jgi:hypothetical protein
MLVQREKSAYRALVSAPGGVWARAIWLRPRFPVCGNAGLGPVGIFVQAIRPHTKRVSLALRFAAGDGVFDPPRVDIRGRKPSGRRRHGTACPAQRFLARRRPTFEI